MRLIEQRAVPLGNRLELLQHAGQLRRVETVDLADFFPASLRRYRSAEVVMPLRDVDQPVRIAPLVSEDERANPRRSDWSAAPSVAQQAGDVFGVILRNADGCCSSPA